MVVKISVLKTGLCVDEMHMRNCQISTVPRHHFEEMTEGVRDMNRDELVVHNEPSGLGRDLFLRTTQFEILSVHFLILFDWEPSFAGHSNEFPRPIYMLRSWDDLCDDSS